MNEMMVLHQAERALQACMAGAAQNLLEAGRILAETKDAGLVPHGEWAAWVQKNTSLSERQAQRLMQAAREVKPDSAMALLPFSKLQTVLALPDGKEREALAQKAQAEDLTVKELREEVKKLKNEKAQLSDAASAAAIRASKAQTLLDKNESEARQAKQEADTLRAYITKLQQQEPETGISEEAQEKINALQRELRLMEEEADQQATARQKAVDELLNLKQSTARGETAVGSLLTPDTLISAINDFMGHVGVLAHMSGDCAAWSEEAKRKIEKFYFPMLKHWLDEAEAALEREVIHQ